MKNSDIRFCVDYQILNFVTRKDIFLIPRIDDLLEQQYGKTVFQPLMPKVAIGRLERPCGKGEKGIRHAHWIL